MTAAHVAAAAGVSTAVVSLVVNGKDTGRVLPETRQRVLDQARRLGYQVDRRARGLATGRSGIVGFVTTGVSNTFFATVQMGLMEAFGDRLQLLSVAAEMGHTSARTRVAAMVATGVDGVIIDGGALEALGERPPVPVMLLDSPEGPSDLVRINFDLESGAEALAAHLLELGHRRIGYVQGDRPTPTLALRHRVFVQRVHAAGGAVLETPSEITIEAASEAILKRWSEWDAEGVTAIVCASDVQAYGALQGLRTLQIPVPGRTALASFDDLPTAALLEPALTCVRLPALELGRRAAAEFFDILSGRDEPREVMLPTELVVRSSTEPGKH